LSAQGASLALKFDGGEDLRRINSAGQDLLVRGSLTVAVPATGIFADKAAATPNEVVAWLNANATFRPRGMAYLANGKPPSRSRNLGKLYAVQLAAGPVTTAVFGGDVAPHAIGGTYPSNQLYQPINAANADPKVTRTAGSITYALDPVDDLQPG